jgi:hypothetical protein
MGILPVCRCGCACSTELIAIKLGHADLSRTRPLPYFWQSWPLGAVVSLLAAIAHHQARRAEAMAGDQVQELVPIETGVEASRFEV